MGNVEFPDYMTSDQIAAAIKRQRPGNNVDWQTVEHPAINDWQNVAAPSANPLNDPGFIEAVTSPEFAALPWEQRRAKLAENVPEFASSTPADQNNIMGMIQKKSNMLNSPQAKYQKIVDLTGEMVKSGEMSPAEEREAH